MTDRTDAPNTHTILVIDDDPDIRRLLRLALEEAGYDVREAQDGNDGLAIAKQEPCSLVIVDLFMPGKEGLETILALRREMPLIKLIAMSGGSGHTDMLPAARSFGADQTIHKPYELDRLLTSRRTAPETVSSDSMNGTAGVYPAKKGTRCSYGHCRPPALITQPDWRGYSSGLCFWPPVRRHRPKRLRCRPTTSAFRTPSARNS
ncbi:MAG: response regulator [Nitrospira sp.]|nr:MAG: response regulator [Nitrospira sp.]